MQIEILKMDSHPITGWKILNERPHTFEADKAKRVWRRKSYINAKKAEQIKDTPLQHGGNNAAAPLCRAE